MTDAPEFDHRLIREDADAATPTIEEGAMELLARRRAGLGDAEVLRVPKASGGTGRARHSSSGSAKVRFTAT